MVCCWIVIPFWLTDFLPSFWVSKLLPATVGTHTTNIFPISHLSSKPNSQFFPFNRSLPRPAHQQLHGVKTYFLEILLLFRSFPELSSTGLDLHTMLSPREPYTWDRGITLSPVPLPPLPQPQPQILKMTEWAYAFTSCLCLHL